MVATHALARRARPRIDSGTFLLVFALVVPVIVGLLSMHVLAMHPSEERTGHDVAGAAMATLDVAASMQTAADHGVHAGDRCMSSSPQPVAVVAPAESLDLTPAGTQPPVIRAGPAGDSPDLFSLCVQRR